MAKFAQVTYGTHGDTKRYTYIVNDNVKAGAVVYPVVTHYKTKQDFSTTGIVQTTAGIYKKGTNKPTKRGQEFMNEIEDKNMDVAINNAIGIPDERNKVTGIKEIKTGDELGVYHSQFAERESGTKRITKGQNAMPTKATQRTATGERAVTLDPNKHYEPTKSKFSSAVMEKQLQNQTIYGFQTIYQK